MSYDFYGKQGEFSMNGASWAAVYQTALDAGWQPIGTAEPEWEIEGIEYHIPDWDGKYWSNNFQTVVDRDAKALALALKRAAFLDNDNPKWRTYLLAFAQFAEAGEFMIG